MKHNITFTPSGGFNGKQLLWVTDPHFDASEYIHYENFLDLIASHHPHAILIGGDIGNGKEALRYLEKLAHMFTIPIFFVLGNHDFYYGSIHQIRLLASSLCQKYEHLDYLTDSHVIALTERTAIIGHDGWSDGQAGEFLSSDIVLNDYLLIEELNGLSKENLLKALNYLGNEAAQDIKEKLITAFKTFDHIILLIHTPPFVEACYYGEHPADINWTPHFVCQSVGEVLREQFNHVKDKHLLVLCGHTHTGVDVQITPNLRVLSGESVLGRPSIQGVIYIS